MKFNNYLNESKEEKIIYNDFIKYMLKKHNLNIKVNLNIRKNVNKKTFGYIDLKSKKNIITIEDAFVALNLKRIAHELTHIIQKAKGELSYDKDMIIYKGKPVISISDYNKADHHTHDNLSFEKEAIDSKALISQYLNKEIHKLKGQSPTLDFIIDYI